MDQGRGTRVALKDQPEAIIVILHDLPQMVIRLWLQQRVFDSLKLALHFLKILLGAMIRIVLFKLDFDLKLLLLQKL